MKNLLIAALLLASPALVIDADARPRKSKKSKSKKEKKEKKDAPDADIEMEGDASTASPAGTSTGTSTGGSGGTSTRGPSTGTSTRGPSTGTSAGGTSTSRDGAGGTSTGGTSTGGTSTGGTSTGGTTVEASGEVGVDVDVSIDIGLGGDTSSTSTTSSSSTSKPRVRRLYVRAGVAHIQPLSVSREMELADVDGAASLAVENGPIAGSGASVGSATVPAIIVGYRLPWLNNRLSIETVLGLPFEVKLKGTGTLANESLAPMALGIPTGVPPLGEDLGTAKAAPPTVTAVYNLYDKGRVQPYVGAGVAVLFAFDEKVTNPMLTEVSQPEMSIAPAPGIVFQGGIEAKLFSRVYARLDVKFIALMMARAEVKHVQVRTPELPLFDTVEVGTARMNVWVNPLIIQAGIGTDF